MKEVVNAQLRLRRAFRYGYIAFVGVAAALLALLSLWTFSGDAAIALTPSILTSPIIFVAAAAGLGLSVPLFLAAWLLVSSVILGDRVQHRPLMDGVRD